MSEEVHVLYGAWSSFYTGKVRSYLIKKRIPFRERVPGHPHYRAHVRPLAGTHHIPCVERPDGEVLQDSTVIIDALEGQFPDPPAFPPGPRLRLVAHLMEVFGQDGLMRPAMHYRWNFPEENSCFIFREFGRAVRPSEPEAAIMSAGSKIAGRMSSKLVGLGIDAGSIPLIERRFLEMLRLLDAHFSASPYLLGGLPSVADYNLMAPLFAHLSRDPYPARLVRQTAPAVARWIEQMNTPAIQMPEFDAHPQAYPKDDEPAETLLPVLRAFAETHGQELRATADAFEAWLGGNDPPEGELISPEQPAQPTLPPVTAPWGGGVITFTPRLHSLWLLQRAQAFYAGLPGEAQSRCDLLLDAVGLRDLVTRPTSRLIVRRGHEMRVGAPPRQKRPRDQRAEGGTK